MAKYQYYTEHKETGFEWLKTIPEHWKLTYSKWLFKDRNEKAIPSDEMLTASQKYGVIPQKLFMEMEQQKVVLVFKGHDILKHVEKNDFVISMRSFQGGIEYCNYVGAVSSAYVPLEPQGRISTRYFKYLFKSRPYIQALQATTNLVRDGQALRYSNFLQVHIPVLPFEEAESIGLFLDFETAQIDILIEKQQTLIKLLKEKRQAVISHAVTKGLNPDAPMKDSGVEWLGEVPEHWEVKKLKYLIIEPLQYGANEAAEEIDPTQPRFVRITDVLPNGDLKDDTFRSLPEEIAEPYMLTDGDVLLARSGGTVGKSFIYRDSWGKCCFAGYLIKARIDESIVPAQWFYLNTLTDFYWKWIESIQIQATIQNVSADKYNSFVVAIPPLEESHKVILYIKSNLETFDDLINKAEQAIQLMQERRTALISAAVTGKIDVRGWQAPE
ncbi:restriction endonuclease subunit S [Psychrobacter urativorans]|uniref:Restriction endonuclease subunit S n=1 Tax=Psychrobacter urativorans TaxID=45610 RepID=A0A0M4U7F2_9GAMM|nr:restriction endonuclease subunit S [Psychrobacter urativorans]ALF60114.1 restriction endonuclease subunit S [Psychrobacter urativorans]